MQEKIQKISPIKQRILQFADTLGISRREFYAKTGISRGTLESFTSITEDTLTKFFATFSEINPIWIINGEGKMVKKLGDKNEYAKLEAFVSEPSEKYSYSKKRIPLVNVQAVAGFGSADFAIKEEDIQGLYVIPDFDGIDFMIRVKGSSMYPKYSSGDIVACRKINDSKFIQWNKCYVVGTKEQGILVKRLKQSDNKECLTAVSDNKEYPSFEIPINEITGIALVVGVIRLE